jgi:hypothetical protein
MPPKRRRRRWWRRALLLLALVVLTPLGIFAYLTWAMHDDWAQAEAQGDRTDPHWRLQQLIEEQEPVPDKENSALLIMAVVPQAKGFFVRDAANYDLIFENLPPTARLNSQQLELIRSQLGGIAKPLAGARRLKDMPRGRFPVEYSNDFISTPIGAYQSARSVADWLRHDAYLLAHDGKYDEAVQSCQAILCAGRAMADNLFLIAHLVRVSNHNITIGALERALAQGEASDNALQSMQALLEKEMKESSYLRALRGERAGIHSLFDNVRTGKVSVEYLRGLTSAKKQSTISEWISDAFPATKLKFYPDYLRHMTDGVEIAKLPIHERKPRIDEWDKKITTSGNPLIEWYAPGLVRIHHSECQGQANLRAALAALACERYRLRHGRWPQMLDQLVKEKLLDEVPLDPMDGQPLRYGRKKDHILIYSIGVNEAWIMRDDSGDVINMAFRLWDKEHRGGPPRPPVALPEQQP